MADKVTKKPGEAAEPGLLSGGNPQIAKADGDAADSAEGEHPYRSKPNTGSSQAEHHRSEATRLLL
jgi:hypothetical protein